MEIFKKITFYHYLFFSFCLHLLMTRGLWFPNQSNTSSKEQPITIELISSQKEKPKNIKQIAEQSSKAINNIIPDHTRFLSKHNQKVIKETRAKNNGQFKNSAESQAKQKSKKTQKKPPWSRFAPKYNFASTLQKKSGKGPAQTNDSLKKIAEGKQTLLSTKEFIYYSYYSRIRQRLRQRWEKNIHQKIKQIYRSGRSIASTHSHTTKVLVILNTQGQLVTIKVLGQSGEKDLDAAAIEAFRAAAPFPNPPKGIANSKGQIQIPWEFVIEA